MPDTAAIEIFAASPAETAYLAEIVRAAGFSKATGEADLGLASARAVLPAGLPMPVLRLGGQGGEGVRLMEIPARACEVIAILQSMVRSGQELPAKITIGDYELNTRDNLWTKAGETPLRLTEKETAILAYMKAAGGKPVSRQELLEHVWSYVPDVETHTLETHIYRLRQKIEDDPSAPKILVTQGDGYVLAE
jgi:hypothetical protein